MSRTFRRLKNFHGYKHYMIHPGDVKIIDSRVYEFSFGQYYEAYRTKGITTPKEYAKHKNFRIFSDKNFGFSPPKWFRQHFNSLERKAQRTMIHKDLKEGLCEETYFLRNPLPYWD